MIPLETQNKCVMNGLNRVWFFFFFFQPSFFKVILSAKSTKDSGAIYSFSYTLPWEVHTCWWALLHVHFLGESRHPPRSCDMFRHAVDTNNCSNMQTVKRCRQRRHLREAIQFGCCFSKCGFAPFSGWTLSLWSSYSYDRNKMLKKNKTLSSGKEMCHGLRWENVILSGAAARINFLLDCSAWF